MEFPSKYEIFKNYQNIQNQVPDQASGLPTFKSNLLTCRVLFLALNVNTFPFPLFYISNFTVHIQNVFFPFFLFAFFFSVVYLGTSAVACNLLKLHVNKLRPKCQQLPTLLGVVGQQCCYYTQQVPTSANIVVVPCKRTQQVTTLLAPTLLGVVGEQCWVRLHGPLQ